MGEGVQYRPVTIATGGKPEEKKKGRKIMAINRILQKKAYNTYCIVGSM